MKKITGEKLGKRRRPEQKKKARNLDRNQIGFGGLHGEDKEGSTEGRLEFVLELELLGRQAA
jgi:hypothetical protein